MCKNFHHVMLLVKIKRGKIVGSVHISYLLQQMGDGKGDTTTHGEAGNLTNPQKSFKFKIS